jgi:metal-responsive CopG/Arc/MetJ family transcriptional regulator
MKAAISIPDDLFAEAERLAHRLKRSRSRLYADAMREYLARHDQDAVTAALNRALEVVEPGSDPAIAAASRRLLERVEW